MVEVSIFNFCIYDKVNNKKSLDIIILYYNHDLR